MAILNLAGNFQPNSITSGSTLPQEPSRAPSASESINIRSSTAFELAPKDPIISTATETVNGAKNSQNPATQEEVKNEIETLQQFNQSINRSLQFEVDEELGVTIVRVIDKDTEELIRQFPPEELINLTRRLKELNQQYSDNSSGILLQEKV